MLHYHKLPAFSIYTVLGEGNGPIRWQYFLLNPFQCVNDVIYLINCVS